MKKSKKPETEEQKHLAKCKDIMMDSTFTQKHVPMGAVETFTGSCEYNTYYVTINHLSATHFDFYVKYKDDPELHKFYNCDSSSYLYALTTLLKHYEIFGAPRRSLLSRIFHRNK